MPTMYGDPYQRRRNQLTPQSFMPGPATNTLGGELRPMGSTYVSPPDPSGYYGTTRPNGKPLRPKHINRMIAQQEFGLRQSLMPSMIDQLNTLIGQGAQSRMSPELRASFLAPRREAIDQNFDYAQGALDRMLQSRGLGDSGYAVNQFSNLAGQRAGAMSGMMNDLYQTEDQRQMLAQAQARDLLASMLGRSTQQAGSAASQHLNYQLQRRQLEEMLNQGGFGIGELFAGLGGLAGLAGQMGWNPFGGGGGFGLGGVGAGIGSFLR